MNGNSVTAGSMSTKDPNSPNYIPPMIRCSECLTLHPEDELNEDSDTCDLFCDTCLEVKEKIRELDDK